MKIKAKRLAPYSYNYIKGLIVIYALGFRSQMYGLTIFNLEYWECVKQGVLN